MATQSRLDREDLFILWEHNLKTIEEFEELRKNTMPEEIEFITPKPARDLTPKKREYMLKQQRRLNMLNFYGDNAVTYRTVTGKETLIKLKDKYGGKIENLRNRLRRSGRFS